MSTPFTKGMSEAARTILVIEGDPEIAELLRVQIQGIGCGVEVARDGPTGLTRAASRAHSLVVLDQTLPGLDGLELCRRLRARDGYTPILMISARTSELDRVLGLELGADDYVTKPFGISELLARVKAILRRVEAMSEPPPAGDPPCIERGALAIDIDRRRVVVESRAVDLTAREFDLLVHLARHPGRVYTRSQLLDLVWGGGHDSYPHTVSSHVNRLRAKIEKDPSDPAYVLTVWGVGYRFRDRDEATGRGEC